MLIVKSIEQNLEDLAGGDGDGGAGAENAHHARLVQEIIILCGELPRPRSP